MIKAASKQLDLLLRDFEVDTVLFTWPYISDTLHTSFWANPDFFEQNSD